MGREDLAKKQDEERYNKIIKRQEELSRLEHNLGMIVKVNKIKKFLGTAKKKVADKKKSKRTVLSEMSFGEEEKEKEVPSLAEQVMFNPDLLRMIGGFKKDLEYRDKIEEILDDIYFAEHSDDSNTAYINTWIEKLLEDLVAKKNPAVSEKIGAFYIYGGEGSHNGALYDMVNRVDDKLDFPFEIILTSKLVTSDDDIKKYFSEYLEYRENYYEDEDEDDAIESVREETPEVYQMSIKYKDNKGRLDAIDFLKVFQSVIEKKIEESYN
jgi:hypothetical protein